MDLQLDNVFKFKKKKLIKTLAFILLLLILASLTSVLRAPLLNTFKFPFSFLTLLRRELGGIIFYHRNFISYERLNKEVNFLRHKINEMNEIYQENIRLKNLLSFKQKSAYKVIAAAVTGRSADNWSSVVIINKGRNSGIKRGMVVTTYLGLVGRVIETQGNASRILLINDPNISVSAIDQRSRQEGLVQGTLGGNLVMRYLPKEADVQIQDTIVSSGLTGIYPKGLLIGSVIEIGEEFSGLTRYAIIKPAVNLSSIEEVLIIIP